MDREGMTIKEETEYDLEREGLSLDIDPFAANDAPAEDIFSDAPSDVSSEVPSDATSDSSDKPTLSLKAQPHEKKEDSMDWLYKSSNIGGKDFDKKAAKEFINSLEENENKEEELSDEETVKLDRYICSSCGAILLLHGEQASKECGFCGNPTITFDKVSDERKPDKILPFKLSKEQAFDRIKKEYLDKNRKLYISPLVENMDVSDIRGIYIPNWLYTGTIRKRMVFKPDSLGSKANPYIKDASSKFERVPIDAALNLNDEMTANLEPYDFKMLEDFTVDHLKGFYADKFDMTEAQGLRNAEKRFDAFMTKTLVDSFAENMRKDGPGKNGDSNYAMYCYYPNRSYEIGQQNVTDNEREVTMDNIEYVFLPVYFVTLKAGKETYTVLVNGQTGRVTGNLPISVEDVKPKYLTNLIKYITIFTVIEFIACLIGLHTHKDIALLVPLFVLVPAGILSFISGIGNYKEYKLKQQINQGINDYTNKR